MGRIGLDGVFQVWPSQDQGEVWYFNVFNFNGDTRFNVDGQVIGTTTDGFAVNDNPSPHVYVETSTGYVLRSLPQNINHKEIASKGFMWKDNDWEAVELTSYFNVIQADNDLTISIFARGAEFSTPMPWCPGSSYKLEIRKDGKFRFVKQQYFLQATPWGNGWVDVPDLYEPITLNGWFGVKFVVYNIDIGNGKQGVKLEFYLDPASTNAWLKVGEYIDAGGWGGSDVACGGATDQIITWGGPLVGWSWDSAQQLRFRLMSVRTVNPGGSFGDPVPQPGKVLVSSTHVYRIGIAAKQTCETPSPTDPNPPPPPPPPASGTVTTVKKIAEQHDINKDTQAGDEVLLFSGMAVIGPPDEPTGEGPPPPPPTPPASPPPPPVPPPPPSDTTAPVVSSVTPTSGSTNFPIANNISVVISEPVQSSSVNGTNILLLDNGTLATIPSTVTLQSDNQTILIDPTSNLANSTTYRVRLISGGVKDIAGNGLAALFEATFTTVAAAAPFAVSSVTPANTATGISVDVVADVLMNAPVDTTTVNSTNVRLLVHSTATPVACSLSTTPGNDILIDSTSSLAFSTTYRVQLVAGGVKRLSDASAIGLFESTFTTAAAPPPPPPPPPPTQDQFGVAMLFPTKTGGRVWNAPFNVGSDRTISASSRDPQDPTNLLKPLGSGSYAIHVSIGEMWITGDAPRVYIFKEPEVAGSDLFENVEVTAYYNSVATTSAFSPGFQGMEMSCRGQHELAGTNAKVYYSRHSKGGTWWRLKEKVHPTSSDHTVSTGIAFNTNTWYGMKHVVQTIASSGNVRMRDYRSTTNGPTTAANWTLMSDFTDTPTTAWGGNNDSSVNGEVYKPSTSLCACHSIFFRTDNAATDGFKLKWCSIREIDPL